MYIQYWLKVIRWIHRTCNPPHSWSTVLVKAGLRYAFENPPSGFYCHRISIFCTYPGSRRIGGR